MNKQGTNGIGWCDYTINPIKGLCKGGCSYCYARRIYDRFKLNPEVRLDLSVFDGVKKLKKPSKIFVCSTHEIFGEWIKKEWREQIFRKVEEYPQHVFQVLTKQPENIRERMPDNVWLGITHTGKGMFFTPIGLLLTAFAKMKFISFEPLLDDIASFKHLKEEEKKAIDWVIVGAMTGPGSREHQPKVEWIENILKQADESKTPVFFKNNLIPIMGEKIIKGRQYFPNEANRI